MHHWKTAALGVAVAGVMLLAGGVARADDSCRDSRSRYSGPRAVRYTVVRSDRYDRIRGRRDDRHDRLHDRLDRAHDRAHDRGFSSRRAHERYHDRLDRVHDRERDRIYDSRYRDRRSCD
jgi:hypothetical protein